MLQRLNEGIDVLAYSNWEAQFLVRLEPCADEIVSAAARRSILVGGGAPPVLKNWRRRPKNAFFKNFVLSSKFSEDLFLVIENCNKINTQQKWHRRRADRLSAALLSTKGGGAHKLSSAALQRGRRTALGHTRSRTLVNGDSNQMTMLQPTNNNYTQRKYSSK